MAISDIRTAEDTEAVLKKLDDKIEAIARQTSGAGGYVASHKPTAGVVIGNTELVTAFVVVNLTAGRRYQATWQGDVSTSATVSIPAGGFSVEYNLRVVSGNAPTSIAGTKFSERKAQGMQGFSRPVSLEMFGDFVAASSGEFTVAATHRVVDSGFGADVLSAAQTRPILLLTDIGV